MAEINQIAAQVAHSVDLQRVANSIARGETPKYDELEKIIKEILLEHDEINTKALRNELIKQISSEIGGVADDVIESIVERVNNVIRSEVAFQYAVLSGISSIKPTRPKIDQVTSAIINTPLVLNDRAMSWDDRIGAFKENQIKQATQIINAGWANGETTTDIVKKLIGTRGTRGALDMSKSAANALAKDLISHSSAITKSEVAKLNKNIVIGEKVIVTLDSRTSPICRNLGSQDDGGKEFYYADVGRRFPRNPFHYRCRSTMIFIVNPKYDLEIETTRPAVVDGKAIQVDSKTDWYELAKRYPALAEQALGPTRAGLLDDMSAKEFHRVAYNSLNDYQTIDEMIASSKKVASLLK